jgi:CspA family cold shock protein
MPTGTIKFFDKSRGFGFIKTDVDSEPDIYVNIDDVEGPNLTEGERVEFGTKKTPKGPQATNVKQISVSALNRLMFIERTSGEKALQERLSQDQ